MGMTLHGPLTMLSLIPEGVRELDCNHLEETLGSPGKQTVFPPHFPCSASPASCCLSCGSLVALCQVCLVSCEAQVPEPSQLAPLLPQGAFQASLKPPVVLLDNYQVPNTLTQIYVLIAL